jgi:hypothetical protein
MHARKHRAMHARTRSRARTRVYEQPAIATCTTHARSHACSHARRHSTCTGGQHGGAGAGAVGERGHGRPLGHCGAADGPQPRCVRNMQGCALRRTPVVQVRPHARAHAHACMHAQHIPVGAAACMHTHYTACPCTASMAAWRVCWERLGGWASRVCGMTGACSHSHAPAPSIAPTRFAPLFPPPSSPLQPHIARGRRDRARLACARAPAALQRLLALQG